MGYLPKLSRISSVSGGSILAGYLGARWGDLKFDADGVATNFEDVIAEPVRKFCGKTIDVPAVLIGLIPGLYASSVLAWFYRGLLGGAKLSDLPDDAGAPRFVLNATSLQTGAPRSSLVGGSTTTSWATTTDPISACPTRLPHRVAFRRSSRRS